MLILFEPALGISLLSLGNLKHVDGTFSIFEHVYEDFVFPDSWIPLWPTREVGNLKAFLRAQVVAPYLDVCVVILVVGVLAVSIVHPDDNVFVNIRIGGNDLTVGNLSSLAG